MSPLISALQLVFLLGLILAVIGQIGRRVFASNTCWRCRFDLSGHPNVPDGPFPVVCPECGESIVEPAMLRVDKQLPRVGLRRTGLILMLAIVPVAVVFVRAGYSFDEYRVATDRSIIALAEAGDIGAADELLRRSNARKFSEAQQIELGRKAAAAIMAIPQDRIKPGSTMPRMHIPVAFWGDIYLDLLGQGVVPVHEAQQLLAEITSMSIRFPPHNRVGDPFFVHVDYYGHAVHVYSRIEAGLQADIRSISIGGMELQSYPIFRSDDKVTPDYREIDVFRTSASSWEFLIDHQHFALSEEHLGVQTVRLNVILRTDPAEVQGFAARLIEAVGNGELGFDLVGQLTVQAEGDNESARWTPSLSEIVTQFGSFHIRHLPPDGRFLGVDFTVGENLDFSKDTVIAVRAIVRSTPGGPPLGERDLIIEHDRRSSGLALLNDSSQVVQTGGVWLELRPIKPYRRDRAWRPLVITGDMDPVWIPLETPKP